MSVPVVAFVYSRPLHTKRMLDSLCANHGFSGKSVHIFCDGPRSLTSAHKAYDSILVGVRDTRKIVSDFSAAHGAHVYESPTNRGLAASVIGGVNQVLQSSESLIVLEDDLVLHPCFLRYMNAALSLYGANCKVGSIHGYTVAAQGLPHAYFLRGGDCWGWATWRRAWQLFEPNGKVLLSGLRRGRLCHSFDLNGAFPFTRMLKQQISGCVDSWAIRWHSSLFLAGLHTLYPGRSLVANVGLDGTGAHCVASPEMNVDLTKTSDGFVAELLAALPTLPVCEVPSVTHAIAQYYRHSRRQPRGLRALAALGSLLRAHMPRKRP